MFNGIRWREEGNVEENGNLEACRSVPKRGDPNGLTGGNRENGARKAAKMRKIRKKARSKPRRTGEEVATEAVNRLRDFRAWRGLSCRHGFMALVWRLVCPVRRGYAPAGNCRFGNY